MKYYMFQDLWLYRLKQKDNESNHLFRSDQVHFGIHGEIGLKGIHN